MKGQESSRKCVGGILLTWVVGADAFSRRDRKARDGFNMLGCPSGAQHGETFSGGKMGRRKQSKW